MEISILDFKNVYMSLAEALEMADVCFLNLVPFFECRTFFRSSPDFRHVVGDDHSHGILEFYEFFHVTNHFEDVGICARRTLHDPVRNRPSCRYHESFQDRQQGANRLFRDGRV